jgi:hypothetical protein
MGGDHHATGEAIYHSRVKKMDKIDAVEKPTTPGRGTGPPNIVKSMIQGASRNQKS